MGDFCLFFVQGIKPLRFVRRHAVFHHAVRGFDKAKFVDAREARQVVNETDVYTFRRFDGANAAIVRVVHVAHFEAGTLLRNTARTHSRNTALVLDFGQGVNLVHELRKLGRREEFLDDTHQGARADKLRRSKRFELQRRHSVLYNAALLG